MRHRPRNMWLGRFYWKTVKRWPAVYILCCTFGLAVGIGALFLFGAPETEMRKAIACRVVGVVMILGYGWWLVGFIIKIKRRIWIQHCDSQILFFRGPQKSPQK